MQWACIQCLPNKEHIAVANLQRQGFETLLLTYQSRTKDRHYVTKTLFANYCFVALDSFELWPTVNHTVGVSRILTYQPDNSEYRYPSLLTTSIDSLLAMSDYT